MEDNFNKHLGNKLKLRRLALGLTQTKVAKAINVTFQQIQKYEKGTNGVSSIRLLQLSNYLKVPINYFFEDFSEYLLNLEKSQEGHMNVNYNFLVKLYSELNADQKLKFNKSLQVASNNISKVGLIDTLESGQNLTLGLDYRKENINDINKYFEFKLGKVLRTKENKDIPSNSTLDKKNSNYFGKLTNNLNENINLNYEFSVNDDLNRIQYNSLGATITKNNFSTTFNYIEEDGVIGSTNILENVTTFNFDKQNFITFRTRENREIDLTEYYDLIYEYKNDCLVAGIKYNKTYYKDRDLEPTEDFMLSIKLIPLTAVEQKFAN